MDVIDKIASLEETHPLRKKWNDALEKVKRAIALYRNRIALSFNGGKDSTVILHLLRAALALEGKTQCQDLCVFFFPQKDDFHEIKSFVKRCADKYSLNVREYDTNFKDGLVDLIEKEEIQAIVLGTRYGDPNAIGQEFFCPSSEGWPPFMRVNPILDWSYQDVWTMLKTSGVEYCELYDKGYTSVGNQHDTRPNKNLLKEDGTYDPAFMLICGEQEREGRNS